MIPSHEWKVNRCTGISPDTKASHSCGFNFQHTYDLYLMDPLFLCHFDYISMYLVIDQQLHLSFISQLDINTRNRMRCKQNDIELLNNSRSWIIFAMHVLSVPDLTVGNECFFVLHSQKFNKCKEQTSSRTKQNKKSN